MTGEWEELVENCGDGECSACRAARNAVRDERGSTQHRDPDPTERSRTQHRSPGSAERTKTRHQPPHSSQEATSMSHRYDPAAAARLHGPEVEDDDDRD